MSLDVQFSKKPTTGSDTAVLIVYDGEKPGDAFLDTDKATGNFISHAISKSGKFKYAHGQSLTLSLPDKAAYERVIILSLGKATEFDAVKAEEAGGNLYSALEAAGARKAVILGDIKKAAGGLRGEDSLAHIALGANLRSYKFDYYKTRKKEDENLSLTALHICDALQAEAQKAYIPLEAAAQGVYMARDLVNEPPNTLLPDAYAKRIKDELKPLGVEVEILDEKKLAKMKAGGILAVGQGSANPPRMVIMRWNGGKKKDNPVGLVGKGVTFDTGGISLKPGKDMDEMKMDMGGSAAVVGAMKTLALRKAKANVVGIVGLVENMPSGTAYRPGDIITSLSGKTIEVLNTDAEGRLVLADALAYIQETYKPEIIVDLATLTGAVMVALAGEYCGTYVNNDKLWKALEKAGKTANEKIWRMPLDKAWNKAVESDVADLRNLSKLGAYGGSCTAAAFLEAFIEDGQSWAHLDIAGTAWSKSAKPLGPKFATGFGVRVLDRLIAENYEA